jgi:hypothetical protein
MKIGLRLLLLVGLSASLFLAGCTLRVYGVPKDEWQRMAPAEQQQAREAYQERRRVYEERRLYEAKQRAYEAELRAHQAREQASHQPLRQERVSAPQMIHFMLEGGTVYVAGRHHPYQPVTVALRHGESKHLMLITADERKPHHVQLVCSYEEGILWLSNGKSRVHAKQFSYDRRWQMGQRYQNLELGGAVGLRGGVLRVGSGAISAVPASRSTADFRGEKSHGREKNETNCRDDRGRLVKPGQSGNCTTPTEAVQQGIHAPLPPATSSGNSRWMNNANGDDARVKPPHRFGNAIGSAAASQAQGMMNNGGKNPAEMKGDPHPQESMSPHQKNPQHRDVSSAEAKGKAKAKPQVGRGGSEACSEDAAGKNGKRADCDDESVVGKANAKGKRD